LAKAYANRAWMTTATTGTGTITLGSAKAGYFTFAEAGVPDADTVTYVIVDGADFEIGTGTYTSSGTTLSRDTVTASKIGGVAGTSKINLSGTAEVFLANRAAETAFLDRAQEFTAAQQFSTIEVGHASDTTITRSAAGIIAVEGNIVRLAGKETIWVPASAMKPRATNAAGFTTYDSGTNDLTLEVLGFDTTATEYAHFHIGMPKGWNEGTVTFIPYWTNTGGASTQTVVWRLAGAAVSDDDTLNTTFGTAQSSTDTWLAQNDLHIGPESAAITIGGTPAENDLVVFQIDRDVATDTMAGDALLIGVKIFITYNAATDA